MLTGTVIRVGRVGADSRAFRPAAGRARRGAGRDAGWSCAAQRRRPEQRARPIRPQPQAGRPRHRRSSPSCSGAEDSAISAENAKRRFDERRPGLDHRHRPLAQPLDRGGVDAGRGDEHAERLARGGVEGERLAERAAHRRARLLGDQGGGGDVPFEAPAQGRDADRPRRPRPWRCGARSNWAWRPRRDRGRPRAAGRPARARRPARRAALTLQRARRCAGCPRPRAAVQCSPRAGAASTPSTGTRSSTRATETHQPGPAAQIVAGAVDRIDHPEPRPLDPVGIVERLLGQPARLGIERAPARSRRKASTSRSTSQTGWPGTFSQRLDSRCRSGRRRSARPPRRCWRRPQAPATVIPSIRSVGTLTARRCSRSSAGASAAEHVEQVAGDGDLGDRRGELAILDDEAGGAAAIIAGHRIDALADQLGDVEAALRCRPISCGRASARPAPDGRWSRRRPARRRCRGWHGRSAPAPAAAPRRC